MSNPYYDHTTYPQTHSSGLSSDARAEFELIDTAFTKLPTLTGNANKVVVIGSGGTSWGFAGSTIDIAGGISMLTGFSLTLTTTGTSVLTIPAVTDFAITPTGTYTLFNKTYSAPIVTGTTDLATFGASIKFPAANGVFGDANTLDDYEEGTWTPALGGTSVLNFSSGEYTKIGRVVFFSFRISVNTLGTGSASTMSGLPFTVVSNDYGILITQYTGIATSVNRLYGRANPITTTLGFFGSTTATSTANNGTGTIFGNGTYLEGSGFYFAST